MYEDLTTDLRPDMGAVTTPITLVFPYSTGMPKDAQNPSTTANMQRRRQSPTCPWPSSAHFVMLDQPEAFSKALADFVK